eukprot:2161821-Pleurochrysis_carterae.AAC.1
MLPLSLLSRTRLRVHSRATVPARATSPRATSRGTATFATRKASAPRDGPTRRARAKRPAKSMVKREHFQGIEELGESRGSRKHCSKKTLIRDSWG